MSRQPTDWAPLAGSDPVPGDPDEIERTARSLADMAEEITRQTGNLKRLATAEGWDADAGRTFAESAGELSGELGKTHGRYRAAAGALKGYAPELRHAQSMADTAPVEAKQAQASIDANRPPDYPPADAPTPAQVSAERQRQHAYDDGVDALRAACRKFDDAVDHRDEHAERATRTVREAIDDGLKDSWWDKAKNWISEHADLLRNIARIAEVIAGVLSVLALALAFIPFLGPILLGLAALASLVALVCTAMLALAGEASWADVGLAVLSVVPVVGVAGKVLRVAKLARRARQIKGISRQKQARHIKGTPEYNERIRRNSKPTSSFKDRATADELTREAWLKGKPVPGKTRRMDYDFGRPVGEGPSGGSQTRVRVHMDRRGYIHGHPSGPESAP